MDGDGAPIDGSSWSSAASGRTTAANYTASTGHRLRAHHTPIPCTEAA